MTPQEYGVTPQGFNAKRLIDVKTDLDLNFIAEFGDVNLDAQSVVGQIIGIFAKQFADLWENAEDVYFSQYPNSASGVSLDNVASLNGLTRLAAQRTSVIGVLTGTENTLIPAGSLARIPSTNAIFESVNNAYITNSNSVRNEIEVNNLTAQQYTVVIDGTSYIYSEPILNFSGPFIPGNVINVRLNGVNLDPITFDTDSATTFELLRAEIESSSDVAIAVVVGNSIIVEPVLGQNVTINSVGISGGGPTYSQTFNIPASTDTIATYLAALLNTNLKITASSNDSTITIVAIDTANPYSIIV
ncbi:MAG: baseplate J/gp47 family protein, partial [Nitrososphaeria archaeon]